MMGENEHKVFTFKNRDGEYQIGDGGAHLRLSPKKLQQANENQDEWATSPHLLVSSGMARVQKARREALTWLEGARAIDLELHQPHTKQERKELNGRLHHFLTLLAESLAACGNYDEALLVLPRHRIDLRREYEAAQKAIDRDDNERCGPECEEVFAGTPSVVTRERVVNYVWSRRHGALVPLIACTSCGALNARPADGALADQIAARSRAVGLAHGKRPDEIRRVLTNARLTSDEVFK